MSIKLALLKSGETIISDAKEVVMDGDDPNDVKAYMFENPHTVTTRSKVLLTEDEKTDEDNNDYSLDVVFSPWIVLTKDKNMCFLQGNISIFRRLVRLHTDQY